MGSIKLLTRAEKLRRKAIFMSDKLFNFLRFMAETGITAIGSAYLGLSAIWSWAYGEEVSKTCVIVATLLGVFVGIKRVTYNRSKAEKEQKEE